MSSRNEFNIAMQFLTRLPIGGEVEHSDEAFARGQGGFLRVLAERPKIYSTPYFQDRCEDRARQNIERLLAIFESGVDWTES